MGGGELYFLQKAKEKCLSECLVLTTDSTIRPKNFVLLVGDTENSLLCKTKTTFKYFILYIGECRRGWQRLGQEDNEKPFKQNKTKKKTCIISVLAYYHNCGSLSDRFYHTMSECKEKSLELLSVKD